MHSTNDCSGKTVSCDDDTLHHNYKFYLSHYHSKLGDLSSACDSCVLKTCLHNVLTFGKAMLESQGLCFHNNANQIAKLEVYRASVFES